MVMLRLSVGMGETESTERERAPMPRNLEPMLATPAKVLPPDDGWGYEIKWDGIRARAYIADGRVRLAARRGTDHTPRYPELAAMADALGGREAIFDGEIVAFDESGKPSFQLLQRRMGLTTESTIRLRAAETPATYVAFDLLWLDGEPLLAEPYERRRELLAGLGFDGPHWQAPAHHVGDGDQLWKAIRAQGLEGVVAKRLGSPYRPGQRSREWLKVRYRRGQELVIGGWMPGEGSRGGRVGSLLVGHWDATPEEAESLGRPQRLVYAGGVGTGFTQEMLERLKGLLEPLRREDSPFELGEDPELKYRQRARDRGAGPVWVEPQLVGEFEFSEWTREGTLRQSAFKGLRDDKDPREVVRES
jgi:bifunctional non-homologous end joining protein LigD